MLITDLMEKWEDVGDREDILREIDVKTYVPYTKKASAINALIGITVEEKDGYQVYDSMEYWFNFIMTSVLVYTDLMFSENDEEVANEIDFLLSNKIWEYVTKKAGQDLDDFLTFANGKLADQLRKNDMSYVISKALTTFNTEIEKLNSVVNQEDMKAAVTSLQDFTKTNGTSH